MVAALAETLTALSFRSFPVPVKLEVFRVARAFILLGAACLIKPPVAIVDNTLLSLLGQKRVLGGACSLAPAARGKGALVEVASWRDSCAAVFASWTYSKGESGCRPLGQELVRCQGVGQLRIC